MMAHPIILVVDDEIRSQESLRRVLNEEFEILTASSAEEAETLLEGEIVHGILCDQRMPGMTGVEFLKSVRERWPDPVRMIISGYAESDDIIAGINEAGIYQYITKPWEPSDLLRTVRSAIRLYSLQQENLTASVEMKVSVERLEQVVVQKKTQLKSRFGFERILHADNSPMRRAIDLAQRIAEYDISVLITGESGTGKELLARAIHYNSSRAEKSFVVENCGALPDELLESELFGCKKGAFTGAYQDRIGLFEQADGGTIFLDEIGETSPAFQVKLLRVLQEGEIRPLGARLMRKVNVRVIAATNRNLVAEVEAGRFRRDLYFRLAGFPIHLPPLRERPMDVALLAEVLLGEARRSLGKRVRAFAPEVTNCFRAYTWLGNVRELQNEILRMTALSDGEMIGLELLSEHIRNAGQARVNGIHVPGVPQSLRERIDLLEEKVIREALQRHGWNITRVADELGLSRVGLRGKLERLGLARGIP